jgi:hypothetical protein
MPEEPEDDEDEEPDEEEDDEEPDEDDVEEYEDQLGVYESFDWSPEKFVTLSEKGKGCLLELCRQCARRDMAARRMEVEQTWEAELFARGYQYLFPRRAGGWQLFSAASGKTWSQMQGAQVYETNIYSAMSEILTSALTRDIPTGRFEPMDPDSDPDVTAAEAAENYKEIFAKNNELKTIHSDVAYHMSHSGRVLFYTTYKLDGQRYGFENEREETAVSPETDTEDAEERPKGKPRGREVVEVFGKLGHKVPIQADDIHEMDFVLMFRDVDECRAKAKFPWIEKQIKPGGGVGEIGIDRIARINVALALEGGYVTGDTFNREITISHCWLRPSHYYRIDDEEVRQEFFDNFPDGLLAVHAGDTLAFVRNESMDDHLYVMQALTGNSQNRRGLMTNCLSIQKRLNNWIDLLNDFFVRTVPTLWMDGEVFNVAGLARQNNVPGQRRPFLSVPGRQIQEMIYAEPLPQHQPELPAFIQLFFKDFPEMLSGALPSLFGAESNTDTVGGIAIQRDQALGRLGTPWSRLQAASAAYLRQAVQLAARCRLARGEQMISWVTDESTKMTLEIADLKGNVLCFPESDSNFPETWIQKSSRVQQWMMEAPPTPLVMQVMGLPQKQRVRRDAVGLKELDVPAADSVDKQKGEFEVLLKKQPAPMPNPMIAQAQQQIAQAEQQAMAEGPQSYAMFQQMLPQIQQQLQQLPPNISSCPVAQDASENHAVEAQECFRMMNSPIGRKLKLGNPQQRAAFQNLHLHWQEHMTMAQKLSPPGDTEQRPISRSVSVAVDKMPNNVASQLLANNYGIQATPQDFGEQDAAETEADITKKAADFGRGGPGPGNMGPGPGSVQ